ncbi:MAG: transglycosylase SLT domain-containing protein [Elusimicrobia bacterium]|nr:transglycosylase SLT domain-containing protein [Elusimicrobiota bacterium]
MKRGKGPPPQRLCRPKCPELCDGPHQRLCRPKCPELCDGPVLRANGKGEGNPFAERDQRRWNLAWGVGILLGICYVAPVALAEEISAPRVSTFTAMDAEGVSVFPPAETELERSVEKPAWWLRAERMFEEGVLAETAGQGRTARKKYVRALKMVADNAEDAAVLVLRPEIAALIHRAGEASSPRPNDGGSAEILPGVEPWELTVPPKGVGPKETQIRRAPLTAFAPHISTRSYAIVVDPEDPLVKRYVALYTGPWKERTQAAFDRMGRYQDFVAKAIEEENMPRELIYLPVVESEYQTFAVSRAGAEGMWQFMRGTAKYAGLKVNYWVDERRDPEKATRAALKTLKSLYEWFDDWHLALAAYNRGIYGIQRDLEFTRSADFSLLAKRRGIPLETEQYIPKLMAVVIVGDNAEAYGLRPPRPTRSPPPDSVVLERPLDLKVAAACAGVSESVIRDLNPSLRLWVTPNNESQFTLRVPPGTKDHFLAELAKVKDWNPSPGFVRYTVQKGDILGRIASRYRTTAGAIQRENKLPNSNRLRPGQTLVIRPGRGFKGE